MNIIIQPETLNPGNIYFHNAVNNTVMEDSSFVRIGYSNIDCILNGVYLDISLNINRVDKYFHKYKYLGIKAFKMSNTNKFLAVQE